MKYLMRILVLMLIGAGTACSGGGGSSSSGKNDTLNSSGIEGAYYNAEEVSGDSQRPESLTVFSANEVVIYEVFAGSVISRVNTYSAQGNQITLNGSGSNESETYDCGGGNQISFSNNSTAQSATFEKKNDTLSITSEGQTFIYKTATLDQINRIKSLPTCHKL